MPKDPVCLMDVEENAPLKKEHAGKIYYFCTEFCLKKFTENPKAYLLRHGDILDR
jgi:P-type Cu+ transporter